MGSRLPAILVGIAVVLFLVYSSVFIVNAREQAIVVRFGEIQSVKTELRRRLHDAVPEVGSYLRSVVAGHLQYYGVPRNGAALTSFRRAVGWLWWRALQRRSQTSRWPWARMQRLIARWLPPARICRPYPRLRLVVTTQGRSPVR